MKPALSLHQVTPIPTVIEPINIAEHIFVLSARLGQFIRRRGILLFFAYEPEFYYSCEVRKYARVDSILVHLYTTHRTSIRYGLMWDAVLAPLAYFYPKHRYQIETLHPSTRLPLSLDT